MRMITTRHAAYYLKVSERRIRQLIALGKLPADKVGRDWVINYESLSEVKTYGKPGRPSKKSRNLQDNKYE